MDQAEVYKKLKNLRKERGLTLNNLAEKIGSDYQQLSRVERGKSKLCIDMLMKMANALETPITDLIPQSKIQKDLPTRNPEPNPFFYPEETLLAEILEKIEIMVEETKGSLRPALKASLATLIYKSALQLYETTNEKPVVENFIDCSIRLIKTLTAEFKSKT